MVAGTTDEPRRRSERSRAVIARPAVVWTFLQVDDEGMAVARGERQR